MASSAKAAVEPLSIKARGPDGPDAVEPGKMPRTIQSVERALDILEILADATNTMALIHLQLSKKLSVICFGIETCEAKVAAVKLT